MQSAEASTSEGTILDDAPFDALTRLLVAPAANRRRLFFALLAGTSLGAAGALASDDAAAKKKHRHHKHKHKKKVTAVTCPAGSTTCSGNQCPSGCKCIPSVDGASCCIQQNVSTDCDTRPSCSTTSECSTGELCIEATCEQGGRRFRKFCWPLCPPTT